MSSVSRRKSGSQDESEFCSAVHDPTFQSLGRGLNPRLEREVVDFSFRRRSCCIERLRRMLGEQNVGIISIPRRSLERTMCLRGFQSGGGVTLK